MNSNIIAVIPARGGSKGVPRKNIRILAGKPLIAWTIESALKSSLIKKVIVSTDDREIAKVAEEWGAEVPFLRPSALSGDTVSAIDVAIHALENLRGFESIILLQPTSPLRTTKDIDNCISLYTESDASSCVAIVESHKNPLWSFKYDAASKIVSPAFENLNSSLQRQQLPQYVFINGAIYVCDTAKLCQEKKILFPDTQGYLMPMERSIDIDTEFDLSIAEFLLNQDKANT